MRKLFHGLTKDTFLLTFVSLFSDIATEMLYPILPIFLTQVLFAPASIVGIIEGIATATQYIIQGFSGSFADYFQKRKLLAFIGYVGAACAKPLIGVSSIWQEVLGARFLDRLSTGIRSAPRDGLIAQSAKEEYRGKAFGLESIGDNLGAFLGPLLAALLLFGLHFPIRSIFLLAFIPGILSALLILWVKARGNVIPAKAGIHTNNPGSPIRSGMTIKAFPTSYWKYLFVTALFGIGNFSNAFLILRSRQIGIPLFATILIYACFNLVAALSSFPAGTLSDKIGRKTILLVSFAIFILTYAGFALSTNLFVIGLLFVGYGIFSGIYRGVGKALASDFVTPGIRASAIGWYSTVIGLSGLVASIVAGQLWVTFSSQATFLFGTLFAILESIALFVLV